MISSASVCHWNIRGYRGNYHHLRTLISDSQASVLCLQESRLPNNFSTICPRGFTIYTKSGRDPADLLAEVGGASILIKDNIAHSPITLITNLQAVAIRCHINKLYTICSLYLPPNSHIQISDLEELISQLPSPFLLLGDLNARSPLWGDSLRNQKGKLIENLIAQHPISILNNGSPTHFHIQTNSLSCIDISLCSSEALTDFEWSISDDLYNSDHFPIFLTMNNCQYTIPPKFIIKKANWRKYKELAILDADIHNFQNIDELHNYIVQTITRAATRSIPKTRGIPLTKCVPWWNNDLEKAKVEKNRALRRFYQSKLNADKIQFNRARAKFRFLIKTSRTNSWREYCSTINENTPLPTVWKRIHKIKGKYSTMKQPILQINNNLVADPRDVANIFGDSLSTISKGCQTNSFLSIKRRIESTPIQFPNDTTEEYNTPFKLDELQNALKLSNNSAAGEDEIKYSMISNLPDVSLPFILSFFNKIWSEHSFPSAWKISITIPFHKQGKDKHNPQNYRPIALTSCLCKLMERIVNIRLVYHLESNRYLHPNQYGFRNNRSTTDILSHIDTYIKTAFAKGEHVVAVFFDLQKAYDTTWKRHILQTLLDLNLKGNLPKFIQNFLSNRLIKVKINNSFSDPYPQYEGVPQRSVLSCCLFALAINGLPSYLPHYIESSLYVDDFAIFARSASLPSAIRRIQLAIKKSYNWTTSHGFTFSHQKTVTMHFTRKRGVFPPLDLKLHTDDIPQVQETKFLGIILDPKLSWLPHLKYLRTSCFKTLDILKCISSSHWGADRISLLRIYRALIRSKLDYSCQIYSSANKTALRMLDPIHHQGLRLSLGAFRTTPVESLYSESGEPSLYLRRDKLSLQLYSRILAMPNTPANSSLINASIDPILMIKQRLPSTLGFRIRNNILPNLNFPLHVMPALSYNIPPYTLDLPPLCPGITMYLKSKTPAHQMKVLFQDHITTHTHDCAIYTDGSKDGEGVGFAVVMGERTLKRKLPPQASIFTAELRAVLTALAMLIRCNNQSFIIYSDSRSALESICDAFSKHPVVKEIHRWLEMIQHSGKIVNFCWVPGHTDVVGNDLADAAAREANSSEGLVPPISLPHKDFYPYFNYFIRDKWSLEWSTMQNNKLRNIKDDVKMWSTSCRKSRREEVILSRLRVGHTRCTHEYLLKGEPQPYCEDCLVPLTITHILAECPNFNEQRRRFLGQNTSLNVILRDSEQSVQSIFKYLHSINFDLSTI